MGKKQNKLKQIKEEEFSPFFAIEEASRCLLCYDAPCSKACPAGTDPAKFIRSLRFRNLKGAAETIRENNILGGVCARVCPTSQYCEEACSRCGIDEPIKIGKLQRYLTDYENVLKMEVLEKAEITKEKIAIIGSGPSGLCAAAELAKSGYDVTVFEAREKLGGWLTYGIPEERLPNKVVENEINYVKNLGVNFVTKCRIFENKTIEDLKKEGFKAILISVGLQKSKNIEIEGIDLDGVLNGVEFLSKVNIDKKAIIGDKVIIIGGGDVAMDCAVVAKRLGVSDVKVVYRRLIENMPASIESIKEVQNLNIPIFTGFKPVKIKGDENKVEKVKFEGKFDKSSMKLPADNIIFAIGQQSEISDENINKNKGGIINTKNYATNIDGVFASGDIVEGDKTVVYAIKTGKEAASAIIDYLQEKDGVK